MKVNKSQTAPIHYVGAARLGVHNILSHSDQELGNPDNKENYKSREIAPNLGKTVKPQKSVKDVNPENSRNLINNNCEKNLVTKNALNNNFYQPCILGVFSLLLSLSLPRYCFLPHGLHAEPRQGCQHYGFFRRSMEFRK